MDKIKIANKVIGEGRPVFIVAEAGINHNGNLKLAKRMVRCAKQAGADAIKFQTFQAQDLATRSAATAEYQRSKNKNIRRQYAELKRLQLSAKDHLILKRLCDRLGLIFLSTAYDFTSVDLLVDLRIPAFKISSSDVTNLPLLKYVASKNKPVILSSGMSNTAEIKEAVRAISADGKRKLILLHCTTSYPLKLKDTHLKAMLKLKDRFRLPVGFSDHTLSTVVPSAAAALGAVLIEKHFTLSRRLQGWDHQASLEPDELKEMVNNIRSVEQALGSGLKQILSVEKKIKKAAQKSIVAKRDIKKGELISAGMLCIKRPGTGLLPKYFNQLIGKKAKVNIKEDQQIKWKMAG